MISVANVISKIFKRGHAYTEVIWPPLNSDTVNSLSYHVSHFSFEEILANIALQANGDSLNDSINYEQTSPEQ